MSENCGFKLVSAGEAKMLFKKGRVVYRLYDDVGKEVVQDADSINDFDRFGVELTAEDYLNIAACNTLKVLNVLDSVYNEFQKQDVIYYSIKGILFWVTKEMKEKIRKIEKNSNIKVYHVIKGYYEMSDGEMLEMEDYLYVNTENDSGIVDSYNGSNIVLTWTDNLTWGIKEYGRIGVRSQVGGVVRVF